MQTCDILYSIMVNHSPFKTALGCPEGFQCKES